jgi:hypothetical protein
MSDEERHAALESLLRLSEHPDGAKYLVTLAEDFDKAMQTLLYADSDILQTAQGHARALHEQLKKFSGARQALLKRK